MKILATIATFAMAAAVCAQSATIAGSDLIDQIKKPLAATLKKQGVDAQILLQGSFAGLDALRKGKAQAAIVAIPRGDKLPEDVQLFPFGYLTAFVAVNSANPINELKTSQLYSIYSKSADPRLDTWETLKVANASLKNITAITTSHSDSVIVELFKYAAMDSTSLGDWVVVAKTPKEAQALLAANNSAIAVLGKVRESGALKILAIADDTNGASDKYAFRPDAENVFNGDYSLSLPFYIAVKKDKIAENKKLLKALLADETAAILDKDIFFSAPKNSRKKSNFDIDISK